MASGSSHEYLPAEKKVKKEKINEEIKEFAETAMNELLGWYGYSNKEEPRPQKRCRSHSSSNSSEADSLKYSEGCRWCGKQVDESVGIFSGSAIFCSELCFSQSRRASFKKNKTCDWCRHVRHTVSYVDFQDGASQLQFCSDKCLNQYKMHIFCRETEAHLEVHPHLHGEDHSGIGLITPDLWLKNCKSPDSRASSPPASPKAVDNRPQTSPLPLITVAHPSKLMATTQNGMETRRQRLKIQRKNRKKQSAAFRTYGQAANTEGPQDLRIRHSPERSFEPSRFANKTAPEVRKNLFSPQNNLYSFPHMFPPDPRLMNPQYIHPPPAMKKSPFDMPPVTVLVPYPVVIPLPLPIPIPLPLSSFLAKGENRENVECGVSKNTSSQNVQCSTKPEAETKPSQDKTDSVHYNNEDICSVAVESSEVDVENAPGKLTRRRKRVVDARSRILTKKKTVPV